MTPSSRRSRARITALFALAVVAVVGGTATASATTAAGEGSRRLGGVAPKRFIVRLASPVGSSARAVAATVAASGGRLVGVQPAVGTVVVELDPAEADRLGALPAVRAVTPDGLLRTASLGFSPSSQQGSMTNVTWITGAQALWAQGWTGKGIDVALVDTGVAPAPALNDPAKVVVGPDLSFESQDPDLRYLDTYGHGTHMAGIIAGRETPAGTSVGYVLDAASNFYGMAPDARILSLKLADHNGLVDVSQVIAAIDWVVQHAQTDGLNVRVLNLSYGTTSNQPWSVDPLSWAAEVAWHAGIVVVAAAGNDGVTQTTLANPAYNPWILAVGAADTKGTLSFSDDTVPSFSGHANGGGNGVRNVDLVAPGVGVVAPAVPGSDLYATYPKALVGNGYIRGSGTSQATAVVSGGVALLLQQRPGLTPDQVKDILRSTAIPLVGQPLAMQGKGEVNFAVASMRSSSAVQTFGSGKGNGSIETTRHGHDLSMNGVLLKGEVDVLGAVWNDDATAAATASRAAWNGGVFNGNDWTGAGFAADTTSVAGKTWSGKTWTGKTWTGNTWSGKTWTSLTWSSATWTGTGWSASAWPSPLTTPTWASSNWSTSVWQ